MDGATPEQRLDRGGGIVLAYHHTPARDASAGNAAARDASAHDQGAPLPGIVFLGGFRSDMTGGKAVRLEAFCRARGQQFTRFDYRAHGRSSGAFEEATIGAWLSDALAILDTVTTGPQILVGSSMGGWIMLLAALARRERVAGLIGIAPAPDFVVRMADELSPEMKEALSRDGYFLRPTSYAPEPYVVTRRLIEEGRDHLLLDRPIDLAVPVRILHGQLDDAVPWQLSLTLAERLASRDVRVTFIKDGDHRLSTEPELDLLCATAEELSATVLAVTAAKPVPA